MPMRRCIEPGCGQLFDRDTTGTWRCPTCQPLVTERARARRARATEGRPSTAARGYGTVHRKRAAQLVAQALASGWPCGICGLIERDGERVSVAHHVNSDAASGDPAAVRLAPAHASCNSGHRPHAP